MIFSHASIFSGNIDPYEEQDAKHVAKCSVSSEKYPAYESVLYCPLFLKVRDQTHGNQSYHDTCSI